MTYSTEIEIEISVAVAGSEVLRHDVKYKCRAWDNGETDPTLVDSECYVNRDPQQCHPSWVTTEMLSACDDQAQVEFRIKLEKYAA